mmetsp:Transcript_26739/g.103872  ORF Transcript_26739/g.103872 Transcript_26739/m.103872 type:complete len:252 (-) Transcript_26739:139-894(-)
MNYGQAGYEVTKLLLVDPHVLQNCCRQHGAGIANTLFHFLRNPEKVKLQHGGYKNNESLQSAELEREEHFLVAGAVQGLLNKLGAPLHNGVVRIKEQHRIMEDYRPYLLQGGNDSAVPDPYGWFLRKRGVNLSQVARLQRGFHVLSKHFSLSFVITRNLKLLGKHFQIRALVIVSVQPLLDKSWRGKRGFLPSVLNYLRLRYLPERARPISLKLKTGHRYRSVSKCTRLRRWPTQAVTFHLYRPAVIPKPT